MIVVSNTSPITNLAAIGRFDLLREVYSTLHIPEGVWDELNAFGKRWPGSDEVASAEWVKVDTVLDHALVVSLMRDLDKGESETIALGIELKADIVLMDELEGRHIARRFGIPVVGTVGTILLAKEQGFIERVKPLLDALRWQAGFFLSDSVYLDALRLAREQRD